MIFYGMYPLKEIEVILEKFVKNCIYARKFN